MEEYTFCTDCCLRDEPAFCTGACPFGLPMRDMMEKLQRGRFDAAYRVLRNAVGFPAVVAELCPAPCEAACVRADAGGAINIHRLEQAIVAHAGNKEPVDFNVPPKPQRIAVVGGGLSGLACALRFAVMNYAVTVFEAEVQLGGSALAAMDPAVVAEDIALQFRHAPCEFRLDTRVTDLAPLAKEYGAVYVATGAGGDAFSLAVTQGGWGTDLPGVFLGGGLTGKGVAAAIADGLHAAGAMEAYLKTGNMATPAPVTGTRMVLDPRALGDPVPPIQPAGNIYTKEEAVAEAKRCLRCACDSCRRHCDLLRIYQKDSKRYMEEIDATVVPSSVDGTGTVAKRLVGTCNECGLCAKVCPEHIDAGGYVRLARQEMRENRTLPWVFHEYWLRDMAFTNGPEALVTEAPAGTGPVTHLFFPGCQLGASDPRYTLESYAYLCKNLPRVAISTACCGAPADWAGDKPGHEKVIAFLRNTWEQLGKPKLIFACPTCEKMFHRYLPDLAGESIYEVMAREGVEVNSPGETVSVFDACASREDAALQQGVRDVLAGGGYELSPLPYERDYAQCCSYGGHVSIANPDYARQVAKVRVEQSPWPYVVYCANCRDVFRAAGKRALHLLDAVFELDGGDRPPPTPGARRDNRRRLKKELLRFFGKEEPMEQDSGIRLILSDALRDKLAADLLLEEDVARVIGEKERAGVTITDGQGMTIAHGRAGNITLWACYTRQGGDYILHNAYSHRMSIEEQ